MSTVSTLLRSALILQVFSVTLTQYPMPFPYPQLPPMGGPIAPIPPLPPQNFLSHQMPMHFPMQKSMPSVVMPYYSRKKHSKKLKKQKKPSYIGLDSSESDSREFDFRRAKTRRQVLTPVVSYVTKEGYVVYQKKIKKEKAKDWLEMTRMKESQELPDSLEDRGSRRSVRHKKNYGVY